jgi:hypothetical protein
MGDNIADQKSWQSPYRTEKNTKGLSYKNVYVLGEICAQFSVLARIFSKKKLYKISSLEQGCRD